MKWRELKVGDVLIDEEDVGDDYILVGRDGPAAIWLFLPKKEVIRDKHLDTGDVLGCFSVYRGRRQLQKGMDE